VGVALDEELDDLADELLAEAEAEFVGAGLELAEALLRDGSGDELFRPAGGGGLRARGEGEGVDVDEAGAVDDFEGVLEVRVGLAGERDDHVGGEGGTVEGAADAVDHAEEIVAGVLAVHAAEDGVGAGLEGEVKVGDDLGVGAEGGQEVGGEVAGLEAGEAQAAQAGDRGADCVDQGAHWLM